MERLQRRFKGEKEKPAAPAVDTSAHSTRTQEVMHQIALFREARGLEPVLPSNEPYRRECLKK